MGSRASNRSYDTAGLEDAAQQWMQRGVRIKAHPEWGVVRVLRWFPAVGQSAAKLRVFGSSMAAPLVLTIDDVEVVR